MEVQERATFVTEKNYGGKLGWVLAWLPVSGDNRR
jgi:hypothetical protein